MIELYTYFRSSASYRVRIALHLKRISFTSHGIDLKLRHHQDPSFKEMNGQMLVPYLKDGHVGLSQSLVILDYLEDIYSRPSIYPSELTLKYKSKELAQFIASEMHPLNNMRVLKYMAENIDLSEDQKTAWYHHWLREGFDVLEAELSLFQTEFAVDKNPTIVDICLIPQIYNALRFKFPMDKYKRLMGVYKHCLEQDTFIKASPEMQDDCDI